MVKGEWRQLKDDFNSLRQLISKGLKKFYGKFFLTLDEMFGGYYDDDYQDGYNQYVHTPPSQKPKCKDCNHVWIWEWDTKRDWRIISGKPFGTFYDLDDCIRTKTKDPGHTETALRTLLDWKKSGFDIVYNSWNHYRCKKCKEVKMSEFYNTPSKRSSIVIDVNGTSTTYNIPKKYETQPLPTIYRREVAVEPVKKYVST
jgi:predicted nucleic-acid-binding Zn-ribbon protein